MLPTGHVLGVGFVGKTLSVFYVSMLTSSLGGGGLLLVFVVEELLPCYSLVGVFWWEFHSLVWVFACSEPFGMFSRIY